MSKHSLKSRRCHPNAPRERFFLDHVCVEICPTNRTFALFAGNPDDMETPRPLFTGFVERGMGTVLRRIAHRFDDLEPKAERD